MNPDNTEKDELQWVLGSKIVEMDLYYDECKRWVWMVLPRS